MGILDHLMGPEADDVEASGGLGDPPDHNDLAQRPSSAVMASASQTVPVKEELRADEVRGSGKEQDDGADNAAESPTKANGGASRGRASRFVRGGAPGATQDKDQDRQSDRQDDAVDLRAAMVASLAVLLDGCRWGDVNSPDSGVRAQAQARQFHIRKVVRLACARGHSGAAAEIWSKHAGADAPAFADVAGIRQQASKPADAPPKPHAANDGEFGERASNTKGVQRVDSAQRKHSLKNDEVAPPAATGGGGGGVVSDLVTMPIMAAGAAGSLVLAGLGKAVHASQRHYVKRKVNGHNILAGQIEHSASRVVEMAGDLKSRGIDGLMKTMAETGKTPSHVVAGMGEGGPHEALGQRFDGLMTRPEVAQGYAELQTELDRFGHLSKRYGKTGADLNLDIDTPVDAAHKRMVDALDGMPMKEDGKFELMQERLAKLMEEIRTMIQSVLNKIGLAPAP